MKFIVKVCACVVLLMNGSAYAAMAYLGGGVGGAAALDAGSNIKGIQAGLASIGGPSVLSYDKTSHALAITAGIGFNAYVAAEFSYTYLGTYKLSAVASSGLTQASRYETDKVDAISLAAIGGYPIYHKIKLLGKLGLANTSLERACTISGGLCVSETHSGVNLMYGAGIAMRPVRALEIRVDYTLYSDVGDKNSDFTAGNFGLVETSVFYHF